MANESNQNRWLTLLLAINLLLVFYIATYVVLVKAVPRYGMSGEGGWPRMPEYSVGGEIAEKLFHPIQLVDRRIRKEYWTFTDQDMSNMTGSVEDDHKFSDYFKRPESTPDSP